MKRLFLWAIGVRVYWGTNRRVTVYIPKPFWTYRVLTMIGHLVWQQVFARGIQKGASVMYTYERPR